MTTKIRRLGNLRGIINPKSMLQEAGLKERAEVTIEQGAIVLRRPCRDLRPGWADASWKLAEAGDDNLVWQEFCDRADRTLQW